MRHIKIFLLFLIGGFLFCSTLYGQDDILDIFNYTYDDFDGNSIDPLRWGISDPSGIASVSGGFLQVDGSSNQAQAWLHLTLPQQLCGDFGIMVSFHNFLYDTPPPLSGYDPSISLQASWEDSGTHYEAYVGRELRSYGNVFYSGYYPGSDGQDVLTAASEGKLFLLRTGSSYLMGYNDGTETVVLQTFEGGWPGEVRLDLMSSTGYDGVFHVDVDYLKSDHLLNGPIIPPTANPNGPYLGAAGSPIDFDGTGSSDPDGDPLTYDWDFGDTNTGTGATPNHTYADPGVYEVCLSVDDGCAQDTACTYVVVYDTSAGFVTGGGWIDSPEGAYEPDPTLTGKANFGFVSKYKKGAHVPTGQTEFVFQTADLNFHSDSYNWLVVNRSGDRAQYLGKGTINGLLDPNGNFYKFMLWAVDGELDAFRIKIWIEEDVAIEEDQAIETVVYDNGFENSGYENGQPISGGSILIHTEK
jgi:hypothetical protein